MVPEILRGPERPPWTVKQIIYSESYYYMGVIIKTFHIIMQISQLCKVMQISQLYKIMQVSLKRLWNSYQEATTLLSIDYRTPTKTLLKTSDRTKLHFLIRAKTSFPKIRPRVAQRIPKHFVPTKTVLYEFMTERDGTVRRLHQLLLRASRESDLMRQLVRNMEISRKEVLKIVQHFISKIA